MPDAVKNRNLAWRDHPLVPKWVDVDDVGLDRFFTRPEVANSCVDSLTHVMRTDGAQLDEHTFVEPAVGRGAFYDLLPGSRRIGIDVVPSRPEFAEHDFLTWTPPRRRGPFAVVGNLPFGYRAWLALAFVNHAASFADYLGFILPMAFQGDGKGSPKLRVRGLQLVLSERLPSDSFVDENDQPFRVNALWQVWRKGVNGAPSEKQCDSWLDLFTVDMRKERLCGQTRLREADYFLQRTFYGKPPKLVRSFSDVRYVCGYGLVIKRDRRRIAEVLDSTDWMRYSNLAAHNCRHISMYHIRRVLTDAGFVDDYFARHHA